MATCSLLFVSLCILMESVISIIVVPWNTHQTVWTKDLICDNISEIKDNMSEHHWSGLTHEDIVTVYITKEKREMFVERFEKDICNLHELAIVFIVFIRIICPLGILSNIIPIFSFIKDVTTRTITFLPIVLLSIVNLLSICISLWRTYGDEFVHESSSNEFHRFCYLVGEGAVALSTGYHVVFLAGLKYCFRTYPTHCRILLTRCITVLMALTIWVYSMAFSIILHDLQSFFPAADRITALVSFQTLNAGPAVLILLFMKWSHDTNDQTLEDFSMFPESSVTSCDSELLSLDIVRSINRILKFYLFCWGFEYIVFIAFFAITPDQVLENIFVFVLMEYLTSSLWAIFHCIVPIVYYYNTRQAEVLLGRIGCK